MSRVPARLRRGLSLVLLLNLALGMACSVIFLRHQVDDRHDLTVQVVELDRLAAAYTLARATARDGPPDASASRAVGVSATELRAAADRLRSHDPQIDDAAPLLDAVDDYLASSG
ncbi:MAG: hypothetical protein QOJ32_814, partial [Frankiaceae bacterium]|nr:hypothetical protein [Frankiaceae bacterium]